MSVNVVQKYSELVLKAVEAYSSNFSPTISFEHKVLIDQLSDIELSVTAKL